MKKILTTLFIALSVISVANADYYHSYSRTSHLDRAYMWAVIALVFFVCSLIGKAFKKVKETTETKVKKAKATPFKVEIVNNEKYITLKKAERVAFLRDLKKQTTAELTKCRKELEKESNKLSDIPADVAKYIKAKDTSSLEKSISDLENKLLAIDELIEAETAKPQKKQTTTTYDYWD